MPKFIAMEKDNVILQVHPTCVANHIAVGWKELGEVQTIEASQKKDPPPAEKGGEKDKSPEGNSTPPATDDVTQPPANSKVN